MTLKDSKYILMQISIASTADSLLPPELQNFSNAIMRQGQFLYPRGRVWLFLRKQQLSVFSDKRHSLT